MSSAAITANDKTKPAASKATSFFIMFKSPETGHYIEACRAFLPGAREVSLTCDLSGRINK
jgi:hypothetical protein